jgi:hypothetical protein
VWSQTACPNINALGAHCRAKSARKSLILGQCDNAIMNTECFSRLLSLNESKTNPTLRRATRQWQDASE